MYDFYLVERSKPVKAETLIRELHASGNWPVNEKTIETSEPYKHVLTHQVIHARFIFIKLGAKRLNGVKKDMKFYSIKKIADLPKPVLISRFLADRHLLK